MSRRVVYDGRFGRVTVRFSKHFDPTLPNERKALETIGRIAAERLRIRVDRRGLQADGTPLPELPDKRGWWWTSPDDPRAAGEALTVLQGAPGEQVRTSRTNFRRLKLRVSGKTRRGQSFTGEMWRRLNVAISQRKGVDRIVVEHAGTQRVGYQIDRNTKKKRAVSVRNRTKAYRCQFPQRDADYRVAGPQLFDIMALSDEDTATLARAYLQRIRLFSAKKPQNG